MRKIILPTEDFYRFLVLAVRGIANILFSQDQEAEGT